MALTKNDLLDLVNNYATATVSEMSEALASGYMTAIAPWGTVNVKTGPLVSTGWALPSYFASTKWKPCSQCSQPTRGRLARFGEIDGRPCHIGQCVVWSRAARPEPNRHDRKRAAKVAS